MPVCRGYCKCHLGYNEIQEFISCFDPSLVVYIIQLVKFVFFWQRSVLYYNYVRAFLTPVHCVTFNKIFEQENLTTRLQESMSKIRKKSGTPGSGHSS